MNNQLVEERVSRILEDLRSSNQRITPQKRAILAYLMTHPSHPSAEQICESLKPQFDRMSLATVYNNLNTFVNAGYVLELNVQGQTKLYDFNHGRHAHVICKDCGHVEDLYLNEIDQMVQAANKASDYDISDVEVTFYGRCNHCKKN